MQLIQLTIDRLILELNRLTSGNWKTKTITIGLILSLFTAFPSYDIFFKNFDTNKQHWVPVSRQIHAPLTFTEYSVNDHSANTSFRLTLPALAFAFGLSGNDILVQVCFCLAIHLIALVLLLIGSLTLFFKLTQDKVSSIALLFGTAMIYPGNSLPGDLWGGYDSIAYSLLILSMAITNPLSVFITVFLAAFTDERALIASSLVYLFHTYRDRKGLYFSQLFRPNKQGIAIIVAWISYFLCRYILTHHFGFKTNDTTLWIAVVVMKEAVNNIPLGIISGLEAFWLLILTSIALLIGNKNYGIAMVFCLLIGLITLVTFSVLDITRSMAYVIPAVFTSVLFLNPSSDIQYFRKTAVVILIICAFPTYYVYGQNTMQWLYPLPLQMIRWFIDTNAFTISF